MRALKSVSTPVSDPQSLAVYQRARDDLKIRKEVPLYYCRAAISPMLAGMSRPYILLHGEPDSPSELYYILCHELIHYRRKDILYKWILELTVSLHWMNPFIYLMRRECARACELSCDEAVVVGLSAEGKAAYGDTLISALKSLARPAKAPASVLLCENASLLKERLEALMKTKKITKVQKAAACAITALLFCSMLILGGSVTKAEAAEGSGVPAAALSSTEARKVSGTYYGTDAWLNDPDNPESKKWRHSFMTIGFFENRYGIRLAWNNPSSLYETTRQVMAEEEYTVSFIEETKSYADDPQVMEAIRLCILERRQAEAKEDSEFISGYFKLTNPVVVEVDGPYEGTYDELAEKFYEESKLYYCVSVLKKASKETQTKLTERAYQEDNKPFFSNTAELLSADEQEKFLQKAYTDDRISYFSIVAGMAEPETVKKWVEKAYQDRKINYFSAAFDSITEADQKQYAYRSYEDSRLEFFCISVDALDSYECEELAKRAKAEGKMTFYYVIPGGR